MLTRTKNTELSTRELTLFILKLAAAGALIASVAVAPGLGVVYQHFQRLSKQQKRRVQKRIYDMQKSGHVSKHSYGYSLTKKGLQKLNEEEVWSLPIPRTSKKKSSVRYLVLFDIPGKKERARQALRARLDELGYKLFQDSVYMHTKDLQEILEPFTEFYGIRPHVRFITASHVV